MFKKFLSTCTAIISASAITLCTLTQFTVSAHNRDYFGGTYKGSTAPYNIKFVIDPSAQTSLLNSSVYQSAWAWNNISSEVGGIGIAMYTPGMPTYGFFPVYGDPNLGSTLGRTVPLDSSGNPVSADPAGANSNWYSVRIYMNTSSSAFSGASNATVAAKMTFIHEVGHALKLAHPAKNKSLSGHNKGENKNLPLAVMNQGFPNGDEVSSTVADHDKENLKAKWGA